MALGRPLMADLTENQRQDDRQDLRQDVRQDSRQDARFSELSYYILESLRTLTGNLATLQKSVNAIEISLVSRADLKELREYFDNRIQRLSDRHDEDMKNINLRHDDEMESLKTRVTDLQVKTAGISMITGAAVSF